MVDRAWLRHRDRKWTIGPDGAAPERANYSDVLLIDRVRAAIERLNPALAAETRAEVLNRLVQAETPLLVAENRRLHRDMVEGVFVDVRRPDGSIGGEQVRLIDFDDPDANDWLAVNHIHGDREQGAAPARCGDLRQWICPSASSN